MFKNLVKGLCFSALLFSGCTTFYFVKQADFYKNIDEQITDDLVTENIGYTTPVEKEGWNLVWHDEFDKGQLDSNYWNYEVNGDGGGNNELQYYTASRSNVWVKNNLLYIKGMEQNYKGKPYTSGRINTKGKADFKYGRFDIRAKTPVQQGIWPAIWMLPTDYVYGGWPQSGEIDIMESIGHESQRVYGTIHYGPAWPNNKNSGNNYTLKEKDLSAEFHVYSVEWTENEIKWFIDDILYSTKTPKDVAPHRWPFDQKFHMILNLAIGGQWPGNPDETTVFPKYMFVDYVRVYQK